MDNTYAAKGCSVFRLGQTCINEQKVVRALSYSAEWAGSILMDAHIPSNQSEKRVKLATARKEGKQASPNRGKWPDFAAHYICPQDVLNAGL